MASPFHVFRKNQKILIATLGLLAIGAFVFLPMILKGMSGPGSGVGENPVVVKSSKYGDLTARDLSNLQSQKRDLLKFFGALIEVSFLDDAEKKQELQYATRQALGDASEESVVYTWLLAQRAKELGVNVDDKTILNFINGVTEGKATPTIIQNILKQQRIANEDSIFNMLQQKLLANNLQRSIRISLEPITPGQHWDYFQRLNRRVNAQVTPVLVADYMKKVPEPTEKEIEEFFEEHKDLIDHPNSPVPGFHVEQMANIEYLKADYDQFADPSSVTDEEIELYYKENKDDYRKVDLPGLPDNMNLGSPSLQRGLPMPSSLDSGTTLTPEAPATETPAIEPPATPEPEAASKKPAEATKTPKAPKSESSTSDMTRSVFHLVSMQEKAENKKAEPAPEPPVDAPKSTEDEQPAKTPAPENLDGSSSAIDAGTGRLKLENPTSKDTSLDTSKDLKLIKNDYTPLEEVKDEIRDKIAIRKAVERMQKILDQTKLKIGTFNDEEAISEREEEESALLLSKYAKTLAKENGLIYKKTGLLPVLDLVETEIGKSRTSGYQPVAGMILEGVHDNQLSTSSDIDQNFFLFWRVKKTEAKTPKLTDEGVRKKVIQAWKQVKAREPANAEAEKLAKAAKKSGNSLLNSIAKSDGVSVKSTGSFSWFERGALRQAPKRGQPENVVMPGDEFMKAVYGLEPGDVTVAMNFPKKIAYVIQLTETTPDNQVLKILFRSDVSKEYLRIAEMERRQALGEWYEELEKDAGVKEMRPLTRQNTRQR